tara:strand:+ start:190 stop:321 length:132 start_codon:yes stop_codon:yes gene_type:complete
MGEGAAEEEVVVTGMVELYQKGGLIVNIFLPLKVSFFPHPVTR